jgi:SAM-dependent methyltransferase
MSRSDSRPGEAVTGPGAEARSRALRAARSIGDAFRGSRYFADAEPLTDHVWRHVAPYLQGADFDTVIDLAAGHGRHSSRLLPLARRLYIVDVLAENIDFCRRRFGSDPRVELLLGDGLTLAGVPSESVTLVFCFDAMVHFDSDTVRSYLHEFERVLRPGGRAFCHHSNYTANPGGDWQQNPEWRNFMSRELFEHYAAKAGLTLLRSDLVNWSGHEGLDCYSLLERPRGGDGSAR